MVAPFLGCAFGGWLFDVFLHEDESPINTPFMGLGFTKTIKQNSDKTESRTEESRSPV
jgi:hypothetical protein